MDYTANNTASAEAIELFTNFWPRITKEIQDLTANDFKNVELPLARIKKIMKLDDEVKMISAEAPIIFAKAAEIFIQELSIRAWMHTEDNKRRTLQRNDTALAISKFDQFDFLIDIVPREEIKPTKKETTNTNNTLNYANNIILNSNNNNSTTTATPTILNATSATDANNIQYYFTLPSNGIQNGLPLQLQGLQGLQNAQIIQLGSNGTNGQPTIISLVNN